MLSMRSCCSCEKSTSPRRPQVVIVAPKGAQAPPGPASSHGLTPPMRDARRRHFRQRIEAPPHVVTRVEADLLAIIRVRCQSQAIRIAENTSSLQPRCHRAPSMDVPSGSAVRLTWTLARTLTFLSPLLLAMIAIF